jgi:uncharacterized ion transporter superfamily protein YfcC
MLVQLNTTENIVTENFSVSIDNKKKAIIRKKEKTVLQITIIKVRLFIWNLSPIHWYDTFKEIHVDMNEFISPKNKKGK